LNASAPLILKIQNLSNQMVSFKVKTTAPKRYSVKPIFDVIPALQTKDVLVVVNLKEVPSESTKDSFQIQAIASPELQEGRDFSTELKNLWTNIDPTRIQKYKVRSSFFAGDNETNPENELRGSHSDYEKNQRPDTAILDHEKNHRPDTATPPPSDNRTEQISGNVAHEDFSRLTQLSKQLEEITSERNQLNSEMEKYNRQRVQPAKKSGGGGLPVISIVLAVVFFLLGFVLSKLFNL